MAAGQGAHRDGQHGARGAAGVRCVAVICRSFSASGARGRAILRDVCCGCRVPAGYTGHECGDGAGLEMHVPDARLGRRATQSFTSRQATLLAAARLVAYKPVR